jgi:hypothetical protein
MHFDSIKMFPRGLAPLMEIHELTSQTLDKAQISNEAKHYIIIDKIHSFN